MSICTEQPTTLTATPNQADYLLGAIANQKGMAILALQDTWELGLNGVKELAVSSLDDCLGNLPLAAVTASAQDPDIDNDLCVTDLYDNQDEFGAITPAALMFCLSREQVAVLKADIEQNLRLVLGINSAADFPAFVERIKQAPNVYERLGLIVLSLVSTTFDLAHDGIDGDEDDVVGFRHEIAATMGISTKWVTWDNLDTENDFSVCIRLIVEAKDRPVKTYVELGVSMSQLVAVIFGE